MQHALTYFQIIKRCKRYNNLAQKLLYDLYAPGMTGVCLRYISDHTVVQNIVQKGFIKVFSKIKQYAGKESLDKWIKQFFIASVIEHLMKHPCTFNHLSIDGVNVSDVLTGNATSFLENVTLYEVSQSPAFMPFSEAQLLTILGKLPVANCIIFNLYCIDHYKHEEIAKMLKIDVTTSKIYLFKTHRMLQKELYSRRLSA